MVKRCGVVSRNKAGCDDGAKKILHPLSENVKEKLQRVIIQGSHSDHLHRGRRIGGEEMCEKESTWSST